MQLQTEPALAALARVQTKIQAEIAAAPDALRQLQLLAQHSDDAQVKAAAVGVVELLCQLRTACDTDRMPDQVKLEPL